jgi:hypothetical protein
VVRHVFKNKKYKSRARAARFLVLRARGVLRYPLVLQSGQATGIMIPLFPRFEASYTWCVGWNRLEWTCTVSPCVNKTKGSPYM